jgi:hypothetical protein
LQQRKDVERVQGYLEHPERAEEVDAISSANYAALAEEVSAWSVSPVVLAVPAVL